MGLFTHFYEGNRSTRIAWRADRRHSLKGLKGRMASWSTVTAGQYHAPDLQKRTYKWEANKSGVYQWGVYKSAIRYVSCVN